MKISIVVIVDETGAIGKNNSLLCHLPADLSHFKSITMGKPIIMGRNTHNSIGRVLPGRMNIVLSHKTSEIPGAVVVNSLEQAFELTKNQPEVMIIGGASLYSQALPLATHLYLTLIHHTFDADTYFPAFDKMEWKCTNETQKKHDEHNAFDLTFYEYTRNKKNKKNG
jgi:dihydrofolate reductase